MSLDRVSLSCLSASIRVCTQARLAGAEGDGLPFAPVVELGLAVVGGPFGVARGRIGLGAIRGMRGKKKRVGAKSVGRTSDWKKAYITLSEGKINYLDEL